MQPVSIKRLSLLSHAWQLAVAEALLHLLRCPTHAVLLQECRGCAKGRHCTWHGGSETGLQERERVE
eukprot:137853-Pelagomonas_calceolata.AAC.1